ncbi:MAG: hypothetical protein ABI369_14280 [Acetobacteraceae bacterium]
MKAVLFATAATLALVAGSANADNAIRNRGPMSGFQASMSVSSRLGAPAAVPTDFLTARITPPGPGAAPRLPAPFTWAAPTRGAG